MRSRGQRWHPGKPAAGRRGPQSRSQLPRLPIIAREDPAMRSFFPWRRKAAARQRSVRRASFQPGVEQLESRDTPSITINSLGTVVQVRGDDGGLVHSDTFELRFKPGTNNATLQMRQIVGNVVTPVDLPETISQINISGLGGGTDTVLVKALRSRITLNVTDAEVVTVGDNSSLANVLGNIVLTTSSGAPKTALT